METTYDTAAFEPMDVDADGASERMAASGQTGMFRRLGRWIATLVAVSALALTLAGSLTNPAEAATRPNLGTAAERCADMNGNATVYTVLGVNITYCDWGDGHNVWALD